jgi:hypothetical protein
LRQKIQNGKKEAIQKGAIHSTALMPMDDLMQKGLCSGHAARRLRDGRRCDQPEIRQAPETGGKHYLELHYDQLRGDGTMVAGTGFVKPVNTSATEKTKKEVAFIT